MLSTPGMNPPGDLGTWKILNPVTGLTTQCFVTTLVNPQSARTRTNKQNYMSKRIPGHVYHMFRKNIYMDAHVR